VQDVGLTLLIFVLRYYKFFASRHVTTPSTRRASGDVSCRACVLRRACSNMADDKEAVVLSCIVFYYYCFYFSSQMK